MFFVLCVSHNLNTPKKKNERLKRHENQLEEMCMLLRGLKMKDIGQHYNLKRNKVLNLANVNVPFETGLIANVSEFDLLGMSTAS
jgi:hypothetical protein